MQINVEQRQAIGRGVHNVRVPDFVVQGTFWCHSLKRNSVWIFYRSPESKLKPSSSCHFDVLIRKFLVIFVRADQFKRIRQHGVALFHAGDDVGAAKPMGLGQISH
jgi:hypothetical protein